VITADETPDQITKRLIREVGFVDSPIRAKFGAEAHLA
jgi:hypothetical protein